ncbi:hypothetical protein ON010_g16585 [Phytophthora cinnamomi]|nr:hypothetical protein ON010_g16585 [Phytophthora cinnamomi]
MPSEQSISSSFTDELGTTSTVLSADTMRSNGMIEGRHFTVSGAVVVPLCLRSTTYAAPSTTVHVTSESSKAATSYRTFFTAIGHDVGKDVEDALSVNGHVLVGECESKSESNNEV